MQTEAKGASAPASQPAPKGPVLAFDCSGPWIMAGVTGHPMRREEMAKGQAERLMDLLNEVLRDAGLTWGDLAGLAVGVGPGNFTGIRIAVAAARGLALALQIPARGVSQFEVQAMGAGEGPLLVALPAPQGRAYLQLHLAGVSTPPLLLTPGEDHAELRASGAMVLGWSAQGLAAGLGLTAAGAPPWQEVAGFDLPAAMLEVAAATPAAPGHRPAPLYVRPPDAAPPSDPPPVILDA